MDIEYLNENKVVTLTTSELKPQIKTKRIVQSFVKRSVDIVAGICGLILMVPLTVCIYIAQKIVKDTGPIFYKQLRIGKDGKYFEIYKFRTMVVGADEILENYLEKNEEAKIEYSEYKKLKNDPRITKLGKFLRKTSLDEIPQLINVLKGEMTLVGPRPYLIKEKDDMGIYYNYIIKCKPGITGLWQISGRNETTFEERVKIDVNYLNEYSLKNDFKILKQTAKKVLDKEGAA